MSRQPTVLKSFYLETNKFKIRDRVVNDAGTFQNIELGTPDSGSYWFVERITVVLKDSTGADLATTQTTHTYLLIGDDPQKGIDWSAAVDVTGCPVDSADENSLPFANPGEPLKLRSEGLNVGDVIACNVQISNRSLVVAEVPRSFRLTSFSLAIERA